MSDHHLTSSQKAARNAMLLLYGELEEYERTVLAYSLKDETSALDRFDIDMMVKAALDDAGYDHFTLYSHLLQHAWFSIDTSNCLLLTELFLDAAREYRILAGLKVEIGGQSFVV